VAARLKSWLSSVPETEMVDPLTAVTLPVATARLAPPPNDGRPPVLRPPVPRPGKLP
jgi:hypothetical protein